MKPDTDSEAIFDALPVDLQKIVQPVLSLDNPGKSIDIGPTWTNHKTWNEGDPAPYGFQYIKLNKVRLVGMGIAGPNTTLTGSSIIARVQSVVPLHEYYPLPVPSGTLFGKQQFTLSLNEDGSISKLQYATNAGASDATDAANAIAKAIPTNASVATSDQAQADRIYEQQRLIKCKASPADCTK